MSRSSFFGEDVVGDRRPVPLLKLPQHDSAVELRLLFLSLLSSWSLFFPTPDPQAYPCPRGFDGSWAYSQPPFFEMRGRCFFLRPPFFLCFAPGTAPLRLNAPFLWLNPLFPLYLPRNYFPSRFLLFVSPQPTYHGPFSCMRREGKASFSSI